MPSLFACCSFKKKIKQFNEKINEAFETNDQPTKTFQKMEKQYATRRETMTISFWKQRDGDSFSGFTVQIPFLMWSRLEIHGLPNGAVVRRIHARRDTNFQLFDSRRARDNEPFVWTMRDADLCKQPMCEMHATLAGHLTHAIVHVPDAKVFEMIRDATLATSPALSPAEAAKRIVAQTEELCCVRNLEFLVQVQAADLEMEFGSKGETEAEHRIDIEITSWCPLFIAQRFTLI
jgi:hypothetical protein